MGPIKKMENEHLRFQTAKVDDVVALFDNAADPSVREHQEHWRAWVQYHIAAGPALVAYHGGKLVGAGGIDIRRPGVGTPWVVLNGELDILPKGKIPTAEAIFYLEQTLRDLNSMLNILIETFKIKRLRTDSFKSFHASQRLLKFLGFRRLRRETAERFFFVKEVG